MRVPSIVRKSIRDLRWQAFWYGFGLALMSAFVVFIYPSYAEQLGDFEIPEALKPFIGDQSITSPEGFLSAEIFSWSSILLVIFAIMAGTSALAGEETNGTMDILLAQPVSRSRLVLEKTIGIVLASIAVPALIVLGWLGSIPFVEEMDVSWPRLITATFNLVPLTLVFASLSMWMGAALANRRLATGVVTGIAVLTYFFNYLAGIVDVIEPLRWASPFHYYNGTNVLSDGMDWPKAFVLIGLFALFTTLTILSFARRDIGVRSAGLGLVLPGRRHTAAASAPESAQA